AAASITRVQGKQARNGAHSPRCSAAPRAASSRPCHAAPATKLRGSLRPRPRPGAAARPPAERRPQPRPRPRRQAAAVPPGEPAGALAEPAREGAVRGARDAAGLPPPVRDRPPRTVVGELAAVELDGQLMDGITYTYWTFDGTVPGPIIRVREGDTVELRLTNAPGNIHPHSIDLHAVNGPHGGGSATQVLPGETKAFRFKALNPGLYIYHCATPYVPAHIANGMYGLILVEPA